MSYWHLASNKPILISPAERSIFWNVFLCWLHNLIQEAHKFHSKPFSLTESHPTFFFKETLICFIIKQCGPLLSQGSLHQFLSCTFNNVSNVLWYATVLAQVIFMGRKATCFWRLHTIWFSWSVRLRSEQWWQWHGTRSSFPSPSCIGTECFSDTLAEWPHSEGAQQGYHPCGSLDWGVHHGSSGSYLP